MRRLLKLLPHTRPGCETPRLGPAPAPLPARQGLNGWNSRPCSGGSGSGTIPARQGLKSWNWSFPCGSGAAGAAPAPGAPQRSARRSRPTARAEPSRGLRAAPVTQCRCRVALVSLLCLPRVPPTDGFVINPPLCRSWHRKGGFVLTPLPCHSLVTPLTFLCHSRVAPVSFPSPQG